MLLYKYVPASSMSTSGTYLCCFGRIIRKIRTYDLWHPSITLSIMLFSIVTLMVERIGESDVKFLLNCSYFIFEFVLYPVNLDPILQLNQSITDRETVILTGALLSFFVPSLL